MKNCEIVKDLLPLVAEDMASESTKEYVNTHLETCADCKKAYDALKTPVAADPAAPLKTVRKSVKQRGWLIAGLIACLVAALLIGTIARLKKAIPVNSVDAAFESVAVDNGIQFEMQDGDIYLKNISIDPETGEAFFINEDGEKVSLRDLTVHGPDGTYQLVTDAEKLLGKLVLTADPSVDGIRIEGVDGERYVTAYTTLWHQWFERGREGIVVQISLYDVDAVIFEPYDGTEHEILYQRDGYPVESGFALPRLVMNYYFAIALIATVLLFVPWLILMLTKKQKARRVFDILLLLPLCGTLAFLFAGFPATTIAPLRELIFVCVIAILLFFAGLCGRKLLQK